MGEFIVGAVLYGFDKIGTGVHINHGSGDQMGSGEEILQFYQ